MACVEDLMIFVRATRNGNTIDFEMLDKKKKAIAGAKIDSVKDNKWHKFNDYHRVTFVLDDQTGRDLRFLKDPDEVFWVDAAPMGQAPACPTSTSTEDDFSVESVTNNVLIVRNMNSKQCDYKFTLNFVGTMPNGTTGLIPYDPDWGNGNGGHN